MSTIPINDFFQLGTKPITQQRRELNDEVLLHRPPSCNVSKDETYLLARGFTDWQAYSRKILSSSTAPFKPTEWNGIISDIYEKLCKAFKMEPYSSEHKNWAYFFTNVLPDKFAELGLLVGISFVSPKSENEGKWILPVVTSVDKIIRSTPASIDVLDKSRITTQVCEIADGSNSTSMLRSRAFVYQGNIFINKQNLNEFIREHFMFKRRLQARDFENNKKFTPVLAALGESYKRISERYTPGGVLLKLIQQHEAQHLSDFNSDFAKLVVHDPNINGPRIKIFSEFRPRINELTEETIQVSLMELIRVMILNTMSEPGKRQPNQAMWQFAPDTLILVGLIKAINEDPGKFDIKIEPGKDVLIQISQQLDKLIDHPEECRASLLKIANSPEQLYQGTGVTSPDQLIDDITANGSGEIFSKLANKLLRES